MLAKIASLRFHAALFVALVLGMPSCLWGAEERIPLIVDTNIGTAIDDAFALAAVVASSRYELLAVTTCTKPAEDRAWMVCRFLTSLEMQAVPVAFGHGEQAKSDAEERSETRRARLGCRKSFTLLKTTTTTSKIAGG